MVLRSTRERRIIDSAALTNRYVVYPDITSGNITATVRSSLSSAHTAVGLALAYQNNWQGSQDQPGLKYKFMIKGNVLPEWDITTPLPVTLEEEDGYFIVSDDMFMIYGDGSTPGDATRDYIVSLMEYFQIIEEHAENGDEDAVAQLNKLKEYLSRAR